MNDIYLRGKLVDMSYSHTVENTDYDRASLVVPDQNKGLESIIELKFKHYCNTSYQVGDEIMVKGNVRSYSTRDKDTNHVQIYVYTYFDDVDEDIEWTNHFDITGRICKKDNCISKTKKGKDVIRFIIANNIIQNGSKINSYLPCVAWGKVAKHINSLPISTEIRIRGELKSRTYTKPINDNELEFRVAHQLNVIELEEI